MTGSDDPRLQLLDRNTAYRRLTAQHRTLDDRLKSLARKTPLSGTEQLEEARLKKEKLRLKDQMEALVRQFQTGAHDALPA